MLEMLGSGSAFVAFVDAVMGSNHHCTWVALHFPFTFLQCFTFSVQQYFRDKPQTLNPKP